MGFILFIHVLACILLVITILMQAGRGGGLAESFASAESMFGTQTNTFMVRFSTVLAIIFFSTSLVLAVYSAKGQKSLMANAKLPAKTTQAAKEAEPTVHVSDPKPMAEAVTSDVKQKTTEVMSNVTK